MTTPTPDAEALAVARGLTGVLEGVRDELRAVNERQDRAEKRQARAEGLLHRTWVIVLITVASLCIDLPLTGLYIANNVRLDHATAELKRTQVTISELHATQVNGCEGGNATRAGEVALWVHIYNKAVTPKTPPKAREADRQLIAYIKHTFAPRDCQKLYRLP